MDLITDGTDIFVADTGNFVIRKIGISSTTVTPVAGAAFSSGFADGTGTEANFGYPVGIALSGSYLYVADGANYKIRKINVSSTEVTTLAGSAGEPGTQDGTGPAARFYNTLSMTSDGTNLYVVDSGSYTIRKIVIATGEVTTFAGIPGESGPTDGVGNTARFSYPYGIACDGSNLYVTDFNDSTIRKIEIASATVSTLAGNAGSPDLVNGSCSTARFSGPVGIIFDNGNLYVADQNNHLIRKIALSPDCVVSTLAGNSSSPGNENDTGTAATFLYPYGITSDGTNLYVTENDLSPSPAYLIRKIVIASAAVTTLAGNSSAGFLDGVGTNAKFDSPQGITVDGGNLYIADRNNQRIRKIEISSGTVSTFVGSRIGSLNGSSDVATLNFPQDILKVGSTLFVTEVNHVRKIE